MSELIDGDGDGVQAEAQAEAQEVVPMPKDVAMAVRRAVLFPRQTLHDIGLE